VFVFKRKRDYKSFLKFPTPLHETFALNFIQLLNNRIYALMQIFVKTCVKITKLCSFNKDNSSSIFQHFERHAELAAIELSVVQ